MRAVADRGSTTGRRLRRAAAAPLAGVIAVGLTVTLAPAALAAPVGVAAVPTFVDGLSQNVFSTNRNDWIRGEAWVESAVDGDSDGKPDRIHVDFTLPKETATDNLKVPIILEESPYYAGLGPSEAMNWPVDHELGEPPTSKPWVLDWKGGVNNGKISSIYESTWLPRGFGVVHAESPGTGLSEGCPVAGGPLEVQAAKSVVDWLAGNAKAYTSATSTVEVSSDWSSRNIGMMGTSYNGTLPIAVAATGVQGLKAIVPISAIGSWYEYYRQNGLVHSPQGYPGEDLEIHGEAVYSRADREICKPALQHLTDTEDRVTGDYNATWDERNYINNADRIQAAALVAHGMNDWNVMTKGSVALYEKLRALGKPTQLYLHQGGHGGAPTDAMLNRWFTRYLYDVPNGVENLPKAYIVREGASSQNPTAYADFPDVAAGNAVLKPSVGGSTAGALALTSTATAGTVETLTDDAAQTQQAAVSAAGSPNRLLYKTGVLAAPLRISGTSYLNIRLAISKPKANLGAVLVEYPATGNPKIIARGWMDPENRNSLSHSEAVTPGTFYDMRFDLNPEDHVFAAGSRLGVAIMSSDKEYTIRPAAGTKLSVDLSRTSIQIPVVGGVAAVAQAIGGGTSATSGLQTITAEVAAGGLALAIPSNAPVALQQVALTGADQVTSGTLNPVSVRDARGSAPGWSLTGQVSDFTSGTGTILADNLGWRPSATVTAGGLPFPGTETPAVTAGDVATPGSGLGTARTLCSAAGGRSAGAFGCGGGLDLGIPGAARLGSYTAVLTLTLI